LGKGLGGAAWGGRLALRASAFAFVVVLVFNVAAGLVNVLIDQLFQLLKFIGA
jgi:hypothetical protein